MGSAFLLKLLGTGGGRALVALWAIFVWPMEAQQLLLGTGLDSRIRIQSNDMAIFLAGEERRDLPCAVAPDKAVLGFDLRFHAGYEVVIPVKELGGGDDVLKILFRVIPQADTAEPAYFIQQIRVPDPEMGGDVYLQGSFDVGEGNYRVEWLMRDRMGRVCSSFWDVEATLAGKDGQIEMSVRPWVIRASDPEQFLPEPPVIRGRDEDSLHVKLLVNFAPQNPTSATLRPVDTSALVSILRTISREPRIGRFSLVAFNLQKQRVFYRQENADGIDFPALGESLDTLELGTVELAALADKDRETNFLTALMQEELAGGSPPDALIIAGPKAMLNRPVARADLELVGELKFPIYYMNYNLNPYQTPWRDAIGQVVQFLKGSEYTISRPRDLWFAVSQMVARIAADRQGAPMPAASSE